MGCQPSKKIVKQNEELPIVDATRNGREIIESEETYDAQIIKCIKDELRDKPEMFLVNSLLMCIVIFKNYEEELYDFSNTATPKDESELNEKLVKEVKTSILPDVLLDKVQKNIKFRNNENNCDEQLCQRRIYLVNDNIEVRDRRDVNLYNSADVPGCRAEIEETYEDPETRTFSNANVLKMKLERKGFLKLRVLENTSTKMKANHFKARSISKISECSIKSTPPEAEPTNDQDDEYSMIYAFNSPKSINIIRTSQRRDTLPETCFKMRKIRKLTSPDNYPEECEDDDENSENIGSDEDTEEPQHENTELYEDVQYLSSAGFMEYFTNEIFPNSTGEILGFSYDDIESAKAIPGCILCDKKRNGECFPFRITPSVAIDWPSQANGFGRRTRKTIRDDRVVYTWPTNHMISELKTLSCVVIPKGFLTKKGENEDTDIEWEIHFPKCERYLEMRMSHPQVRCYVFFLILYKTYIEKFTTYHGLLVEHIRTHMFWECEKDAKNWPEHKMGTKILQVIKDLDSGLSKGRMPHYFIKEKNIFENIPSRYLQFSQKVFHDILQFPVLHFIKALKNIRYIHPDFYPIPDLDSLQKLLTSRISVSSTRNSRIKRGNSKKKNEPPRKSVVQVGNRENKVNLKIQDLRWKKKNEKSKRRKFLNEKKQKDSEDAAKETKTNEGDELKQNFQHLNMITKISVLQFFTNHFIGIAKKSRKLGPRHQTIFYQKHAWYYMKVLEEIGGVCSDTQEIARIIEEERELLDRTSQDEEKFAPPTPHRNFENGFVFPREKSGPSKTSFRSMKTHNESSVTNREKKIFRETRTRSVGFDDNIEKISFL